MIITQHKNEFLISFPFNPVVLAEVKAITGRWYEGRTKLWHVPAVQADAVNRLKAKYTITDKYTAKEEFAAIPDLPELSLDIPLKRELFAYQRKGVAYSLDKKRLIMGDQPGLGKSGQAIATIHGAALHGQQSFPSLIICPSSLKENWRREWNIWTNRKAVVMSDSIKNTWPQYLKTGLVEVFIVNYESLKKYFVQEIKREMDPETNKYKPLTLKHIHFKETISLFKSVIVDECHRCFPYETKVLTNAGWLEIGFIVENNMYNLLVASLNPFNNELTFKPILNVWKNNLASRKFYKLTHERGTIYATGNHEIYTSAGKKEICEIKSGEILLALSETFSNNQIREIDSEVLLEEMRFNSDQCRSFDKSENGQEQEKTFVRKNLRLLQSGFLNSFKRQSIGENKVLQSKLLCKMESKNTGSNCAKSIRLEERGVQNCSNKNDAESGYATNKTAIAFKRSSKSSNGEYGISGLYIRSKRAFPEMSELLQSGHCYSRNKIINRSGWHFSQQSESKNSGSIKNQSIECVRVESVEVYEPTNPGEYGYSSYINQVVYDLEIADNHNYFADGILVSNCKDSSTLQAKLVKGMTAKKEWVLGLTGTPVVNKPKDLIAQLAIVQRLADIGGYQYFMKRYCGGDGKGASNLKELHYKLATTCFYQRQKKDVLLDLPDKMRNIILCDISTRKEYKEAEDNLKEYLLKWKNKTDAEAEKSLRGEIMVLMGIQKNISARGKMNEVIEYVDEVVESGEKVVVFVHQKEIALALLHHYPKAVSIRGDDTMDERQRSVDGFQRDPNIQVIICSIKAAGVGITLTASSRVAFVELPWHAADCDQCEDRTHRIGQKNAVQVSYFLGKDTIDEYIYELIESKRGVANDITGTVDNIQREIIDRLAESLFNTKKVEEVI